MTPEQVEAETRKIRLKGLRLTKSEKDTCFWMKKEYGETEEELKELIIRQREEMKEWEQNEGKQLREFVKEWRRLERKYGSFQYEDKTIDELVQMWSTNYFELYFLDTHLDCIMSAGGKKYAQYHCYNIGLCPEKEVTMWQD